jgi:hypothetical protein
MPNIQWNDIPFCLISPQGNLPFNALNSVANPVTTLSAQPGKQWILLTEGCQAGSAKRVARDNSPQKGGEIVHRKFKAGMVFQLKMIATNVVDTGSGAEGLNMTPACGSDLVDLFDLLLLHLNSIENSDGRLVWTNTGKTPRMMLDCRWLGDSGTGGGAFTSVVTEPDTTVFTAAEFALLSPFPYVMDYPQTCTLLPGATPVTVNNTGNTDYFPVIHVVGPAASFDLINNTTGLALHWDSSLPGATPLAAGRAIEFDFFREIAYDGAYTGAAVCPELPGQGPFTGTNMKPGINILTSDFWPIVPGNNSIQCNGAAATMLWQPAYTG